MARYDVRNVCNYGVLIGFICIALLTSVNTYANQPARWVLASIKPLDCSFKPYEDKSVCVQRTDEEAAKRMANNPDENYIRVGEIRNIEERYGGSLLLASIDYERWVLSNASNAENCAQGEYPKYPAVRCEPPPPTCDDPKFQKEFEQAQYACQIGNPNTQLWTTDYQWSCQDVTGQHPNIVSSCNYVPSDCIVGLTCEKAPKDVAYCDPSKETCALPPQTEKTNEPIPDLPPLDGSNNGAGNGSTGTGANIPTNNPNFCDLNPQLCEKQQPPEAIPEPNPTPTEKPDNTELSAGDNAIVGEVSLSNQHLENVNSNLKSLGGQLLEQLSRGNEFSQHQLGVMREMLEHLIQGDTNSVIPNDTGKEEKPKDEEQEKTDPPMASADCDKSIFECRGDVIQCALLKVQYDSTCTVDEFAQLEEAFKGIKLLNNEALLVQKDSIDYSRMNQKYLNGGVSFGSGACPAPERISFRAFGDSKTIDFKFDPACRYAELLRPLLIAFAWLTGLFIIGRTQGAV